MLSALPPQFSPPALAQVRDPDVRGLFSGDDVPMFLVSRGEVDLTVLTRTTVRPDGTLESCVVEASSGDARLDAYTCGIIVRRAKFLPARWVDGSASYGVIRMPIRWQVTDRAGRSGDQDSKANIPDLDLSLNSLPKGAHRVVRAMLEIAADEKGHPVKCAQWNRPPSDGVREFPELTPIACQQAIASLSLTPPLDTARKPVRSVQTVTVHFTRDSENQRSH